MISNIPHFGRSVIQKHYLFYIGIFLLSLCLTIQVFAVGTTGLYVTRLKLEYQYSDYAKYDYPLIVSEDHLRGYEYLNPYLHDFPEHRLLTRLMQAIGPQNILELRHEYSALNEDKNSHRYFGRFDKIISQKTTLFASSQLLNLHNSSPDSSSNSGGYAVGLGVKYDNAGWLKIESSISYDRLNTPESQKIHSYTPMLNLRYAVDDITAIGFRYEGFFTDSDSGNYTAYSLTSIFSRYLPTKTGMHLSTRFYNNDYGIASLSPSVELAQYLRWNLLCRVNYRYYQNNYQDRIAPRFIKNGEIHASSVNLSAEWQLRQDLKLSMRYRRYVSDQNINMNSYLGSLEFEL